VTYYCNFGTASISRVRFELKTSNLGCRLSTGGTDDKNEKKTRIKGVGKGLRDLLLEFWDPLRISRTVLARNFKFGMQIEHQGP